MIVKALIVDDEPDRAKLHSLALEGKGAFCILASSVPDALRIMKNYPGFELVISDLNFGMKGSQNVEGEKIGEWIKRNDYPAHSVLCSARYAEEDKEYKQAQLVFADHIPHDGGIENYDRVHKKAVEQKSYRLSRSKLTIDPKTVAENSSNLLKVHELTDTSNKNNNKEYFASGYEIVAVQPTADGFRIGNPFFVWSKSLDEGVFLEVYGHPNLLAFEDNFEDALIVLNEILYTTYQELSDGEVSGSLISTKKFLDTVYDRVFETGEAV